MQGRADNVDQDRLIVEVVTSPDCTIRVLPLAVEGHRDNEAFAYFHCSPCNSSTHYLFVGFRDRPVLPKALGEWYSKI